MVAITSLIVPLRDRATLLTVRVLPGAAVALNTAILGLRREPDGASTRTLPDVTIILAMAEVP